MNILILEDDPIRMVQFRARIAEQGQHNIIHFESAYDVNKALETNKFDLILLDHDLGGRSYIDHTNDQEDCGMRVAEFLSIRPERVKQHGPIIVHSLNGPAAQQMVELIAEACWIPFLWTKDVWNKFLKFPV